MELYPPYDSLNAALPVCVMIIATLIFSNVVEASSKKGCTRQVKEEKEKYSTKRISVKKKHRARCSESDELASLFSGADCKDRYEIAYMTVKHKVKYTTYRMEACCPGECKNDNLPRPKSGTTHAPNTTTIVTIVVPVVAVVLLIVIAVLLIRRRFKHREKDMKKQQYNSVNDSNSTPAKTTDLKSDCGDLTASDKLIPFGVEVVDNSPPSQHPSVEPLYKMSGCQPFVDSYDTIQHISETGGDNISLTKQKQNTSKNRETTGRNDTNYLCDLIRQNRDVTAATEASAPSYHTIET